MGNIVYNSLNEAPTFPGRTDTREVAENTEANHDIGLPVKASDPDRGDSLTYALGVTDLASFDIDTSTGQLKTKAPLDFESGTTSYSVIVTASDTDLETADDAITVTITVTDANDAPTFNSGLTTTIEVDENTVAGRDIGTPLTATDQDTGDTVTYSLDVTSVAVFDIDSSGQLKTKGPLDYEEKASYTVTLSVRDSRDVHGTADTAADNSITVTVNVTNLDEDGTITLSSRQPQVSTEFTATLFDPAVADPTIATWAWEKSADKTTWTTISSAADSAYTPVAEDVSSYLQVTAMYNDGQGGTDKSAQTVSEFPVRAAPTGNNTAPTFTDGDSTSRNILEGIQADRNIGNPVSATDVDADDINKLTYQLGGTDAESFDIDIASGQLKTKDALDYDTKSAYEITVTVVDPSLDFDSITVNINVTRYVPPRRNPGGSSSNTPTNSKPAFDESGPVQRSMAENTEPGVAIGEPVTATDADDTQLAYAIQAGSDGASFDIDSSSGQLKTKASLDYETKASYSVTLSVTDGKNANGNIDTTVDDTVTVTITVTDANDAPAFASETATREVAENTATGQNIGDAFTATDQDAGDTLTYTVDETSAAVFDIDANGQLKTKASLDYETKASYSVTLSVTDGKNANGNSDTTADDTVIVSITVTDANDAPAFASETATREVAENTATGQNIGDAFTATDQDAGDTLTYTVDETSAAVFDIDANGQLKTKASLDYETKASYSVTLSVTDGKNANGNSDTTADDTVIVSITVTDANDAPAFASETATREVAENTATGQNIGDAFTATDQDAGDTLTYTLDETSATVFNIDSSSGQLKTKASLDYEMKASYSVTLSVTDGKNANGNIDTTADDTIAVSITVTDANDPPAFASETATREVAENTASGQNIGDAFTATDQDAGDTLTYTLDETSPTVFNIDSSSGQLKTKASLDYETKASYSVTLSVTDGKNANGSTDTTADDTIAVSITVTDANDPPAFASETATREVAENTASGQNIGDAFTATDQDAGDTLTYTLDETSATVFDIDSSSGQLKTKAPLDHDTMPSYTVTISVRDSRDSEGNTDAVADDTITVTVNVDQVQSTNPPPTPPVTQRGRSTGGVGGGVYSKSEPTNPEPEFHQSGSVLLSVPENAEPGTAIGDPITATDDDDEELVYSIQAGQDGAHFAIDSSNGQLKTKGPLDYEARTQYQLRMQVKDDDGGTDRISVQIRVTGVPEPPELTGDTEVEVAENATGRLAEYTASDPEGQAITWGLSGDDADDFSMANGVLSFTTAPDYDAPADSDGDNVYKVTVEASDGTDSSTLEVTVTVTNLIDDFRVQGSARGSATESNTGSDGLAIAMRSLSYPENGTAAVATYAAVEPAGDQIAWSLAGNDGDLFSIGNGTLSFDDPPDYEAPADSDEDNAYVVTVQANDGTDSASLDVTISVTDVNEGPTLTSPPATVDYDEQGTGSVATYTATDPEGDDLDWSLSGGDAGAFSIDEGALSFTSSPNYEEPSDSDKDNVYDVTVEASDGTYSDSADVSVTVTDVQEVPITNPATQAVGTVPTGSETTIKTPDDAASVTFPASSRANIYMARVDSDLANCSAASTEDGSPDPIDGDLRVCLTVAIFDTWGNEEQDATLAQPASVSLMMDADDLGGVEMVQEAYDQGGINIYTRGGVNDEWSTVEFTLTADEEGTVTITVTGVTQFSSFAAATDTDVFNQLMAPSLTPTPTPTPTPRQQQTGSGPVSMMSGTGIIRMPPRPPSTPMAMPAPSTDGIPPDAPPVAQAVSVEPVVLDVVEKAPLWALIVLIMGSVMCASGTGMVAYSRLTAPPPWMRVPGAEVKGVKRRV